ncbi:integration host factor, actinobacterial type [Rhodococcus sp. NPDC059968]|uniref:integration host factor, actinobacterial type n=1 Tax=Rhodococcus sp. NPDC059968 TaxID=3347017 RepID=UPI0036724DDB
MALPVLTDEQRAAALAKATEARKVRGEMLAAVKAGELDVAAVLERAENEDIVKKTKVSALLKALPKVGPVKAAKLLEELSIAESRRLGGLGQNQRRALLDAAASATATP